MRPRNAVMQNSSQQNTFREVPGGARHKAGLVVNSLQSSCAERICQIVSKYEQTGAPVTEQGHVGALQSDPRHGGKKSGTAESFSVSSAIRQQRRFFVACQGQGTQREDACARGKCFSSVLLSAENTCGGLYS